MQLMVDYARAEQIHITEGQVLRENTTMIAMCKQFGSSVLQTMTIATCSWRGCRLQVR